MPTTFSFLPPKLAQPFAAGLELVQVDAEKKKAEPAIRPSLLPSLLSCRKSNQDAGNKGVRLFEVAQVFGQRDKKYAESKKLSLLCDAESPATALRQVRGTIEELQQTLGRRDGVKIVAGPADHPWAQPAARVVDAADPSRVIGEYGPARPAILKLFDLQTPVILAELDYPSLLADYPPQPQVAALPKFPAIERDLSLIVDEPLTWQAIETILDQAQPALLEGVEFVTTYRGKPIPPGHKSVTFRMTFRDPQRTLLHDEVSGQVEAVIEAMKKQLNAEVRV